MPCVTRSKPEILEMLSCPGVIAVVRAQDLTEVLPMFEALLAGGILATEYVLNLHRRVLLCMRQ